MKTTEKLIAINDAKNQLLYSMPSEKELYTDPITYGLSEEWRFDEDRYNSDTDYAVAIQKKMAVHNERAAVYNDLLNKLIKVLA